MSEGENKQKNKKISRMNQDQLRTAMSKMEQEGHSNSKHYLNMVKQAKAMGWINS